LSQCAACGRGKQREGSRIGSQSQLENEHFDLPRIRMNVSSFFDWSAWRLLGCIEYLSVPSSNKKPPATALRGAIFR
jgi:hypothetical protein